MSRACRICHVGRESQPLYVGPRGGIYCIECYPTAGLDTQHLVRVLQQRVRQTSQRCHRDRDRRWREDGSGDG